MALLALPQPYDFLLSTERLAPLAAALAAGEAGLQGRSHRRPRSSRGLVLRALFPLPALAGGAPGTRGAVA